MCQVYSPVLYNYACLHKANHYYQVVVVVLLFYRCNRGRLLFFQGRGNVTRCTSAPSRARQMRENLLQILERETAVEF